MVAFLELSLEGFENIPEAVAHFQKIGLGKWDFPMLSQFMQYAQLEKEAIEALAFLQKKLRADNVSRDDVR